MTTATTPTIRKAARIHDKASDTYFESIVFPISVSETKQIELRPSAVNDLSAFEKNLRDKGALLPKDDDELKQLLHDVAKSDAAANWVYEAQTGWTEDHKAFVLMDGVIGENPSNIKGVKQFHDVGDLSGRLSTSGTVDAWRETVAKPAGHSTVLMTAISASLAAPLLALINSPSFTVNLYGRTRSGKTVATLVAGSVIGTARDADLITWNITDTRLEQRLPEFNDSVCPIDDLMTMRAHDKDKYQRVRDLAYKIAAGWSTGRDVMYMAAHEGAHRGWRVIALTSNEKSVRDLAQAVRLERQGGESVRLIDVPALVGGASHIFDQLPDNLEKDDVDAWKRATFAEIVTACEQNHGLAWRTYIKALIAQRSTLQQYVEKRVAFFEKHACDEMDGPIARDVARKFGLLYAGGMLGIRCGLLPWQKKQLLSAITTSFCRARYLLPDDGILLRTGLATLRAKLRKLPTVPQASQSAPEIDYDKIDGYKQPGPDANRYLIKREAYRQLFSSGEQEALVTQRLIEKQRITLSIPKGGNPGQELSPQAQFTWPDGERRRSMEIAWRLKKPRALKKGESKNNKKKKRPQAKKDK